MFFLTIFTRSEAKPANTFRCANAARASGIRFAASSLRTVFHCCSARAISRRSTVPDRAVRAAFANIAKETRLNLVMTQAAMRGATGSVALLLSVLRGRIFIDVMETMYLTPTWDPEPDTLARVDERYKVSGRDLVRNGYTIDDPEGQYWFSRCWDKDGETWFDPVPVGANRLRQSSTRSALVSHKLGAVLSYGSKICLGIRHRR